MTIQGWEHVKELLHQAMQLAPEQRASFLDEACSSDVALRAEVESLLLAGQDVRSNFLQSTPLGADSGIDTVAGLEPGQIFAQRFQLVRKLGEGGMGQVWLAEQTSPVRRQVALKLIKAGMYDESVVKRFQAERQSLAIMDHPAIAKVFDAGATPQGQPFFVMEYVPGAPITEYCDQKKLKIADRLELFIQACEGVQHAHQKAVIHRDLKPANILVVEVDGKPVPRIIDFGLAKAMTPHSNDETLFTQMGHFVGTPGYMSPEQADPGVKDIDTRTDVYSLGAVLYLLLAGVQPLDSKTGEKLPLDELLRKLREEEPPSPSTRVSGDRNTSSATAEARGTVPKQLAALLRGDLDWITMKALEKDRTRRYGTPSELAADIRRYLNHETVSARPAQHKLPVAQICSTASGAGGGGRDGCFGVGGGRGCEHIRGDPRPAGATSGAARARHRATALRRCAQASAGGDFQSSTTNSRRSPARRRLARICWQSRSTISMPWQKTQPPIEPCRESWRPLIFVSARFNSVPGRKTSATCQPRWRATRKPSGSRRRWFHTIPPAGRRGCWWTS